MLYNIVIFKYGGYGMTYDYARLAKIKCFLFDMDGTINLCNELIPGM